jgi:hemerythrin-like domain-containing protein
MANKKPAAGAASKDAIGLIKKDHGTVRELLSDLEETTARSAKKRIDLLERLALEVRVHAQIEEEIFYPAFHDAAKTKEDEKLFHEAAEEHAIVHEKLPVLESTDPATELFSARAKVMKDLIEHHAEEEEKEILPRAKELLGRDELVELGQRMQDRKEELLADAMSGR